MRFPCGTRSPRPVLSARHPLDLLVAFRQDVTKRRYGDWDELMEYCSYSAMPVGRFVLDVHGESEDTWAPSDALCSALQVINHLQDCAKDYRDLDRVYLPLDALAAHGTRVEALAAPAASPQLRACLVSLAEHTGTSDAGGRAAARARQEARASRWRRPRSSGLRTCSSPCCGPAIP